MAADNTNADAPKTPAARPLTYAVEGTLTVPVVNRQGQEVGTVQIDPTEFSRGGKINRQLMHEVVLMYRANQRAGTHSTLRRGEVAGSTKKLFRQKGTGNARAGTKRTNKRRGGGTAKGPKPRDYEYHLPKKAVQSATRMAILSKFADNEAVIVDEFTVADRPKTKAVTGLLKAIKVGKKVVVKGDQAVEKDVTLADQTVLIGTDKQDPNVYRSARNIEGVEVRPAAEFNCYTVLKHKRLVLTRAALDVLREKAKAATSKLKPLAS
jgi:large subunit ribosomal protein L4